MTSFEQRLSAHASSADAYLAHRLGDLGGVPDRLRDAMQLAVMGGGQTVSTIPRD